MVKLAHSQAQAFTSKPHKAVCKLLDSHNYKTSTVKLAYSQDNKSLVRQQAVSLETWQQAN
jgi:protein associated with RNAse G/E